MISKTQQIEHRTTRTGGAFMNDWLNERVVGSRSSSSSSSSSSTCCCSSSHVSYSDPIILSCQ